MCPNACSDILLVTLFTMARPPFVGPGYRGLLGGQTPEIPETDLYAIRNTATTSTDLPQGSIRRASFPSRHGHDGEHGHSS